MKTSLLTVKDHNLFTVLPRDGKFVAYTEATKAFAYSLNSKLNLITGERSTFSFFDWLETFENPYSTFLNDKRIIHLFYEAGFVFEKLDVDSTALLAIDIEYTKTEVIESLGERKKLNLSLVKKPDFESYKEKFKTGYEELKLGNCYQFNLTDEYIYSFGSDVTPIDFMRNLWSEKNSRGDFAHATYCDVLKKLFLSNSPECLFEINDDQIFSRPIKGTMKKTDEPLDILWARLSADKKSQAELFMIADLVRNDLSRIDLPTTKVLQKKAMMVVPQLIHQYSELVLTLRPQVSLKKIITSLFPGGSITGAPKKNVMRILRRLENRNRSFYCGTTIVTFDQKISASINIRSCEIDFESRRFSYQAGGGITLLSNAEEEFQEMTYKHNSILDCLNT